MARAERPYDERPARLYTRDDLMEGWHPGGDHSMTLDGRIYSYVKAHGRAHPTSTKAWRSARTITSSTLRWRTCSCGPGGRWSA
jgi:hypothetical protein